LNRSLRVARYAILSTLCLCLYSTELYQFVTGGGLVAEPLGLSELLQGQLDECTRLGGYPVQVAMHRCIVVVAVRAAIAVDLECTEVGYELRKMPRALAVDAALQARQVCELLRAEAPNSDRTGEIMAPLGVAERPRNAARSAHPARRTCRCIAQLFRPDRRSKRNDSLLRRRLDVAAAGDE